jgi:Domain of unknown function (DUF1996)
MNNIKREIVALLLCALVVPVVLAAQAVGEDPPLANSIGWFETACGYSHSSADDAIVFPGQNNAAHTHDFLGNRSTDENTTNAGLLADNNTNCRRNDEEQNPSLPRVERSAWWVPALRDNGVQVTPNDVEFGWGIGFRERSLASIPAGLRVIAGSSTGGPRDINNHRVYAWTCLGATLVNGTATQPPRCDSQGLRAIIKFPDCWDGVNVDSADHKSHMAYSSRVSTNPTEYVCPTTHPVDVPQAELRLRYPTDGGDDLRLATGTGGGTFTGGINTSHADIVFAFRKQDQDGDSGFDRLVDECLNADEYCGGGDHPAEGH